MKLIKLNAIDSTSSFLKELAKNSIIENWTVVVADTQTSGRGQQTKNWVSEPNKNLTMSVFISDLNIKITHQKYLNFAISLAIFDVLSTTEIQALCIKWPNDIMSANKKICGILVENTTRNYKIHSSVIGIGLNVNQVVFPDFLKNAASLKTLTNVDYNLDDLLFELVEQLKNRIALVLEKNYEQLETEYLKVLYKINRPAMFTDRNTVLFMGKIIGVSNAGNLQIELEDETIKEYGIKEISFA